MNVNFFVTCIGDALKSRMARDSVLLLEKLGCRVNFPEKQGCCGQPAINSGGSDSNLLIVFYVQIMPDDLVMQLHRF